MVLLQSGWSSKAEAWPRGQGWGTGVNPTRYFYASSLFLSLPLFGLFFIWLGWPRGGPQETARDRFWRSRSYRYFFVIKQEEKEREGNSKLKVANHLSGQTHYCQNCLGRRTELAFRRREARTCSPMRFRGQIGGWSVCQREEPQDQEVLLLSSLTATSLHLFSFNKVLEPSKWEKRGRDEGDLIRYGHPASPPHLAATQRPSVYGHKLRV